MKVPILIGIGLALGELAIGIPLDNGFFYLIAALPLILLVFRQVLWIAMVLVLLLGAGIGGYMYLNANAPEVPKPEVQLQVRADVSIPQVPGLPTVSVTYNPANRTVSTSLVGQPVAATVVPGVSSNQAALAPNAGETTISVGGGITLTAPSQTFSFRLQSSGQKARPGLVALSRIWSFRYISVGEDKTLDTFCGQTSWDKVCWRWTRQLENGRMGTVWFEPLHRVADGYGVFSGESPEIILHWDADIFFPTK